MLLRLHVKGFKNLRDVEIRFGPLTCFVGPNGVGKSNIFDAIQFLRRLADEDIQTAAESVRGPTAAGRGPLDLFWSADPSGELSFEADMVVPPTARDEFGVLAEPAVTLLRYSISFRYRADRRPRVDLVHEELTRLPKGGSMSTIGFPHLRAFRASAVIGQRSGGPFISTKWSDSGVIGWLHGDGGMRGRQRPIAGRTMVGGATLADYPTALAARREMSAWHALHLEPSALRTPDSYDSRQHVDEHGGHIAATLHRLCGGAPAGVAGTVSESRIGWQDGDRVIQEAANRLARLVPEVDSIRIDDDPERGQRSVQVKMLRSDQWFSPRSLSDGTLRFLALVAMQLDSDSCRVLCMEAPENGIDPARVPEMVKLLQDIAVDPEFAVDEDNPARQVVINTHSPDVIRQLDAPDVLFVRSAGREAIVRPVDCAGNWRGGRGVALAELEDVIGGAPLGAALRARELPLWANCKP